jgi:hypothetical protein
LLDDPDEPDDAPLDDAPEAGLSEDPEEPDELPLSEDFDELFSDEPLSDELLSEPPPESPELESPDLLFEFFVAAPLPP